MQLVALEAWLVALHKALSAPGIVMPWSTGAKPLFVIVTLQREKTLELRILNSCQIVFIY